MSKQRRLLLYLMTAGLITSLATVSFPSLSKTYTPPSNKHSGVIIDNNRVPMRVCYYQDQAYSEGALLQVGSETMECKSTNTFETNGQLRWYRIKSSSVESESAEIKTSEAVAN